VSARRAAARAALCVLVVAVATGCAREGDVAPPTAEASDTAQVTSSSTSTPSTSDAATALVKVRTALDRASAAKPYSATITISSEAGEQSVLTAAGRINLNAPLTGYLNIRAIEDVDSEPTAIEEVLVGGAAYVRLMKQGKSTAGEWRKREAGDSPVGNLTGYAQLLLRGGPSAVKGEETQNGVAATRLSGRVELEQVRQLEPGLYDRLRASSVDSLACDIWVDRAGHVVRLEQRFTIQNQAVHNILTLSKFRSPLKVKAPAAA
jgi:LppX_LprAFG lipoprotein